MAFLYKNENDQIVKIDLDSLFTDEEKQFIQEHLLDVMDVNVVDIMDSRTKKVVKKRILKRIAHPDIQNGGELKNILLEKDHNYPFSEKIKAIAEKIPASQDNIVYKDFDDLAKEFLAAIDIDTRRVETRERLKNLVEKIQVERMDSEGKVAIFADILLKEYSDIMQTMGAERTRLIPPIRKFFSDNFDIALTKLPKSLLKENKLNLAALMLAKSRGQAEGVKITKKFATMMGKDHNELIHPSPKEKLIWELANFKSKILRKGDSDFTLWFEPAQNTSTHRADLAQRLITALRNDEPFPYMDEINANGELRAIVKKYPAIIRTGAKLIAADGTEIIIKDALAATEKVKVDGNIASMILAKYFDFENNQLRGEISSIEKLKSKVIEDYLGFEPDKNISDLDMEKYNLENRVYQEVQNAVEAMIISNPGIQVSRYKDEFVSETKDFKNKIMQADSMKIGMKNSIIKAYNNIKAKKNIPREEKFQIFADMLIQKYGSIRKSIGGKNDALALAISDYCRDTLGIHLPLVVKDNEHLCLATLLLKHKKHGGDDTVIFDNTFGDLINYPSLLNKFDYTTTESTKESDSLKFTLELAEYKSRRAQKGDDWFTFRFMNKYSGHSKINVASLLIKARRDETDTAFTPSQIDALFDGDLGKILEKYHNFLPPQLQKARKERMPGKKLR